MKNRRTVLVVDDQKINRQILSKILSNDYDVIEAENGKIAVDILIEMSETISAVLLDLIMPEMNGHEVLKKMQDNYKLRRIPVIICTQKEGDESEIEALKLGADDFVSKPYSPEIIKIRLKHLIQMVEARSTIDVLEQDMLTGLLSQEAFNVNVDKELKDASKNYVMIAGDIEQFKMFNDIYGVAEGDQLLNYVADVLRELYEGSLVSRAYADRYFIFTEKSDKNEELLVNACERMSQYSKDIKVSIKFGIYDIEKNDSSIRIMCDRAVVAGGMIKGQYDKCYNYYSDGLRKQLLINQKIVACMNDALTNREFSVYYQPKFDAERETIAGAEALVRWISPDYGFMSPGEFIPLFESNGFITEVDKYVWEEVCKFIEEYHVKTGRYIPVSVNVSRKDIYKEDLPTYFENLVRKYNIIPETLHLEITETSYTQNPTQLIEVVSKLKEKGFSIEMDDFGSGYSSLNMLSTLPIDVLKMDMKFIQNEDIYKNSRNIISAVVNLAKWMNLLVVAEGVETKEQLGYLKKMQCNMIQGYYFAKPMPTEDFRKMLENTKVTPIFDVNSYVENQMDESEKNDEKGIMMVVDDLAHNRAILNEYFKDSYRIIQSENGENALTFLEKYYKEVAIIMLDLYMPVMDGFAVLEVIRNDDRYKNIPVIVTSQDGEHVNELIDEKKADGVLIKPYQMEEAMQIVSDVVG